MFGIFKLFNFNIFGNIKKYSLPLSYKQKIRINLPFIILLIWMS
jgi:hypothetical protein